MAPKERPQRPLPAAASSAPQPSCGDIPARQKQKTGSACGLEPIRTSQSPITNQVRLAGQVNPSIQLFGRRCWRWWVSCIFTTKARTVG
jgi:hypothetical protein